MLTDDNRKECVQISDTYVPARATRRFSPPQNVRCMVQSPPVQQGAEIVQPPDFIGPRASPLLITNHARGRTAMRTINNLITFAVVVIFVIGVVVGFYLGLHAGVVPNHP